MILRRAKDSIKTYVIKNPTESMAPCRIELPTPPRQRYGPTKNRTWASSTSKTYSTIRLWGLLKISVNKNIKNY